MNDRFSLRLLLTCCGFCLVFASAAQADQAVVDRLVEQGELSAGQARVLVKSVSKRMKRAASPHGRADQVGLAVAHALHEPHATSPRGRRRVMIRLRAGLDVWALQRLFGPSASSMALCMHQFKLSSNLCESLAAASRTQPAHERQGGSDEARVGRAGDGVQARGDVVLPRSTAGRVSRGEAGEDDARAPVTQPAPATREAAAERRDQADADQAPSRRAPTARERAAEARAEAAEARRSAIERKREAIAAKHEGARQAHLAALQHKHDLVAARADAKRARLDAQRSKHEELATARAQRAKEQRDAIAQKREELAAARAQREKEQRDAIAQKREQIAAARAEAERKRQEEIQRKRDEVERIAREKREAIEREHEQVEIARRKAEYDKQRAAYLARAREQMAARKDRVVATAVGEKVERGPTSKLEAQLIGMAPEAAPAAGAAGAKQGKGTKAKSGGKPTTSAAVARDQDQATPDGLEMVDALVGEPSAKRVARR